MPVYVEQLFYHPVKSLGGISTNSLNVKSYGPAKDRHMMLVNEEGKFVTQRQKPIMSQIKVLDAGERLTLSLGEDKMSFDWPNFSDLNDGRLVKVWGDELQGQLVLGEVNDWLSEQLKQRVQLVYKHSKTLGKWIWAMHRKVMKQASLTDFHFC